MLFTVSLQTWAKSNTWTSIVGGSRLSRWYLGGFDDLGSAQKFVDESAKVNPRLRLPRLHQNQRSSACAIHPGRRGRAGNKMRAEHGRLPGPELHKAVDSRQPMCLDLVHFASVANWNCLSAFSTRVSLSRALTCPSQISDTVRTSKHTHGISAPSSGCRGSSKHTGRGRNFPGVELTLNIFSTVSSLCVPSVSSVTLLQVFLLMAEFLSNHISATLRRQVWLDLSQGSGVFGIKMVHCNGTDHCQCWWL